MLDSKKNYLCMKENAVLKYLICFFFLLFTIFKYLWCYLISKSPYIFKDTDIFTILFDITFLVLLVLFSLKRLSIQFKHILILFSAYFFLNGLYTLCYSFVFYGRLNFQLFLYQIIEGFVLSTVCALPVFLDTYVEKIKPIVLLVLKYVAIGLLFLALFKYFVDISQMVLIILDILFDYQKVFYDIHYSLSNHIVYQFPAVVVCCIVYFFILKVNRNETAIIRNDRGYNNGYVNLPTYNQPAPQPVYNSYAQSPVYNQPAQVAAPQSTIQTANNQSGFDMFEEKTVGIFSSSYNQPQSVINSAPAYTPELNGQTNEQLPKSKFCGFCGAKLPDGVLFCTQCGKKIV